jgi:DMSO/TMAO reductase YedYZ molybdopterin-dependent catalytic subunit
MALFFVHHHHNATSCPGTDLQMGAMLMHHLSRPNVRAHGLELHAEVVLDGEHVVYLIVEADDLSQVDAFVKPFRTIGSVDIFPASSFVSVMASRGCGLAMPVSTAVPALDPDAACQRAIDAGLVVHRPHPLNCETSIPALIGGIVMPNAHFYVRNHFQIPDLDATAWRLAVGGLVERPLSLRLRDLQNLPTHRLVVTLECAGNGRASLEPPVDGEQWQFGAVSTAEWTGVPLVEVLDRAGLAGSATEIVFRGADRGTVEGVSGEIPFERSLRLDDARDRDVLLAYAMNGEPLPIQHGYPLRLVVPRWYGVASVKWLTEIEVMGHRFGGFFQADRYHFEREENGEVRREPATLQRVRALITQPEAGARIEAGDLTVRGVAWSGAAPIARVEVSVAGGPWQEARLIGERTRHSWQSWELRTQVTQVARLALRARATDLAGRTQPEKPEWNRLGYGNNAIEQVEVEVGG